MKPTFYQVIAQFSEWVISMALFDGLSGTNDQTLNFFEFLESEYPEIWERLNQFYADDESHDDEEFNKDCARIHLYGWQEIAAPGKFDEFLIAFHKEFLWLSGQDQGVCPYCKKEKNLEIEHPLVVSYGFGPLVKFTKNWEMDGSRNWDQPSCRECAVGIHKKLAEKANPEKVECWV